MSRLQVLSAAPHRMMFLVGMITAVLSGAWWVVEIAGRVVPAGLSPQVAPVWLHGWLMLFGLVGPFIFGFLFTTFPRWQNGPNTPRAIYVATFTLMLAGVIAGLAALWLGSGWLVLGVALLSTGWFIAWAGLLWVMLRAEKIVSQAVICALALGVGGVAQLALLAAISTDNAIVAHVALRAGLWGCLLPLVHAVCHRMLPFFSQSVITGYKLYRPVWRLVVVTILFYLHLALALVGGYDWMWVVDVPLTWLLLAGVLRWQPLKSRDVPLLWTLYVAYLWLPLGLALQSVADIGFALNGEWWLGRAPLHALGMGFLMSLIVAMATRVTLGHSGRRLWMDNYTLVCFLLVQLAAILRVASEIISGNLPAAAPWLLLMTALVWMAGLLSWAWRYAPTYLQPRIDGKAG